MGRMQLQNVHAKIDTIPKFGVQSANRRYRFDAPFGPRSGRAAPKRRVC